MTKENEATEMIKKGQSLSWGLEPCRIQEISERSKVPGGGSRRSPVQVLRGVWEGEGWEEPLDWTTVGTGGRWLWLEDRVVGETIETPLYVESFSLKLC